MTRRERLLTTITGRLPDCVPVAPDFSNMIPCRLTGRPFWDLYLYMDPPPWEAYIACAKHFAIDALMDGYFPLELPEEHAPDAVERTHFIVHRAADRIVTQACSIENGQRRWDGHVAVYYLADSPTHHVKPASIGLPDVPVRWEPIEHVKAVDRGPAGLARVRRLMGDDGLVGVWSGCATSILGTPEAVYDYYDNPDKYLDQIPARMERVRLRIERIAALPVRPDFLCFGGSGTLVFQTPQMVRELSLPVVKYGVELAHRHGFLTHVHSCGPETELVKMLVEETELDVIDPLEVAPMGDCDLAELKRRYGNRITLKGNLHTTEVMLRGSVAEVESAARKAIDDAAAGGRFILSTGDQCGRDTPDENLHALVRVARSYGRYGA
jgi:uroporphyrinogen decarboxylase